MTARERRRAVEVAIPLFPAILLASALACPAPAPAQSAYDREAFGPRYRYARQEGAVYARDTVRSGVNRRTPYTCAVVSSPLETDVDHVIPLRWAWGRGLHPEHYRALAADALNLAPALPRVNRVEKGDRGPGGWMPPRNAGWYAYRWLALVERYNLRLNDADRAALDAAITGTPAAPTCEEP